MGGLPQIGILREQQGCGIFALLNRGDLCGQAAKVLRQLAVQLPITICKIYHECNGDRSQQPYRKNAEDQSYAERDRLTLDKIVPAFEQAAFQGQLLLERFRYSARRRNMVLMTLRLQLPRL